MLATLWTAIQLLSPISLIALSSGEHRLSFHGSKNDLVLEHHDSAGEHHHGIAERTVIPHGDEATDNDHVFHLPGGDYVVRTAAPKAPTTAIIPLPGHLVELDHPTSVLTAKVVGNGPAPPKRSVPLLL